MAPLQDTAATATSRYTPCARAAKSTAKGAADAEARDEQEQSRFVSKRRHFARLEELRAQFEGFAAVSLDGPFDMKDHPCLVRHRSPRTSSPRVKTCKTAAARWESRRSTPFCNTILTGSGALGYVTGGNVLPKHCSEYGLYISTLPRPGSSAPPTARTIQPDMLRFPSAYDDELGAHLQAHSLAAHHGAELNFEDSWPDVAPPPWFGASRPVTGAQLSAAGRPGMEAVRTPRTPRTLPPMTPGGVPRSPVMNIAKIEPVNQVTNAQLKAHVLQQHKSFKSQNIVLDTQLTVHGELGKRRKEFLQRALHYLGVPYRAGAEAHPDQKLGPAAQLQSGLYLDCCALIRRCLLDLQDTLEFEVGPYNQAYLYDTLPIVLTEEQLCPGDLIFIQGSYKDGSKRRPKHDIVHVEIFLGGDSGASSLGARDKNGAVDIFNDFRFQSQSYEVLGYHFRSIDTWLGGICKSFCPEHKWITKTQFKARKPARSRQFSGVVTLSSANVESGSSLRDNNAWSAPDHGKVTITGSSQDHDPMGWATGASAEMQMQTTEAGTG